MYPAQSAGHNRRLKNVRKEKVGLRIVYDADNGRAGQTRHKRAELRRAFVGKRRTAKKQLFIELKRFEQRLKFRQFVL